VGAAAYNRGSRLHSRQICADGGCRGCGACRDYKPTPRPPGWGSKAFDRAIAKADRVIKCCMKAGRPLLDVEGLATLLVERERVGGDTARKAAEIALAKASQGARCECACGGACHGSGLAQA
jgi:hypothetical protein